MHKRRRKIQEGKEGKAGPTAGNIQTFIHVGNLTEEDGCGGFLNAMVR